MTTATSTELLDCGHEPTPTETEWTFLTGVATDSETGQTSCLECAYERERRAMADQNVTRYLVYVATDRRTVTTWSGYSLGTVDTTDRFQAARRHYTPTGGYWRRWVWHVTDLNGHRWWGVNGGPGFALRLRRMKHDRRWPIYKGSAA